jgi:hypothetical protein
MKYKLMYCGFAAFMVLFFAVGTLVAHEVTISATAALGTGPAIEAGTYRVEVVKNEDSSHAVFYRGHDEVARAQVALVIEPSKSTQTEVYSQVVDGGRVITQIRLQGSKEKVVFEQTPEEATESE